MSVSWIVAVFLLLACSVSAWRIGRVASAHRKTRLFLLATSALLLYLCLLPPATREDFVAGELVVLTPGTTATQLAAVSSTATIVALPGTDSRADIESVPDLGTALRRHADATRLLVVGGGLPTRDRDAARDRVVRFDAAPPLPGVIELELPTTVRAGTTWRTSGRVEGVAQARLELRDPASSVVAAAVVDDTGRFTLQAPSKVAGSVLFSLRVLDREGARVEEIPIPLITTETEPLRVLLLAGAPDPELKYLRRWASDAGIAIDSRVALTEGIALTEGVATFDAQALQKADVAILDERSWVTLDAGRKNLLMSAVRDGLGLLLRVTGPIDPAVATDWAALGFTTRASDAATTVTLAHWLGAGGATVNFRRRPIDVEAPDAAMLLRADDGSPLAVWRLRAQGRVGLWWLADSWTLVTGGEPSRFATLWGDTLATLARARGVSAPDSFIDARIGERVTVCDVKPGDVVEYGHGDRIALVIDEAAGSSCAGYWPAQAGWHDWVSGDARHPFYVRADGEARALALADSARATRALLGASAGASTSAVRSVPLPRWPFFLTWLIAVGGLWWLERRAISE
jgi:hypothetical protein